MYEYGSLSAVLSEKKLRFKMHVQEWLVIYVWMQITLAEADLITLSYTEMTALNYTPVDKVY